MITAACVQLCSTADVAANNAAIAAGVAEAAGRGATLVSLPEAANILLRDNRGYPAACLPEEQDGTLPLCRDLARRHGIWLNTGSLLIRTADGTRIWNRSHMIAPSGEVVARYDKLHLFDVALEGEADLTESRAVRHGERGAVAVAIGPVTLGLTICYDLRFPLLYHRLARAGAGVMMVPSSFSTVTGPLHWEVLLKARAIETGSYVVAAAQCGTRDGVATWGKSLIVSPFGEVLAAAGDEPCVITARLDPARIADTRRQLPVLTQARDVGVQAIDASAEAVEAGR